MTDSSPAPTAGADSAEAQVAEFGAVPRSPEEAAELFSRLEDALIKQMEVTSILSTLLRVLSGQLGERIRH